MSLIKVREVIRKYPDSSIYYAKNQLFCGYCNKHIKWTSQHGTSSVNSHCSGGTHLNLVSKGMKRTLPIANAFAKSKMIKNDNSKINHFITEKLLQGNIALAVVDNPPIKELFETLSERRMPHSTTLRLNVNDVYENTICKIHEIIGGNEIYLIIDETTDRNGRFVCNILAGVLNGQQPKSMLICTKFFSETNNSTISQT